MRRTALTALLLVARAALADEEKPLAERVALHGWVDAYYGFNANRPSTGANFLPGKEGTSGARANAFSLNQGVIDLAAEPKPVGVHLAVGWGTGFEILHASEPQGVAIGPQVWRHVLAATASAKVPVGSGLTVEGGIYSSHLGFESFPSKDDWTYTRSHMGELSPYYQSGVKASYAFGPVFSAQLHLVDGWQLAGENNEGKALGTQFQWAWKTLQITVNTFAGPETPDDGAHWRLFLDAFAVWRPVESLALALVTDYGQQTRAAADPARWYAAQLAGRWALSAKIAIALRAEVYRDAGGIISGQVQTLSEGTASVEARPWEALVLKLEARFDHSNAAVFDGHAPGRKVHDQPLVMLGTVAAF